MKLLCGILSHRFLRGPARGVLETNHRLVYNIEPEGKGPVPLWVPGRDERSNLGGDSGVALRSAIPRRVEVSEPKSHA